MPWLGYMRAPSVSVSSLAAGISLCSPKSMSLTSALWGAVLVRTTLAAERSLKTIAGLWACRYARALASWALNLCRQEQQLQS